MSAFIAARFPNVAVTEVAALNPAADETHECPERDLAQTETTRYTTWKRYGATHTRSGCESCLPADLVELHHGNPQPAFVRVEIVAEQAEAPAALVAA